MPRGTGEPSVGAGARSGDRRTAASSVVVTALRRRAPRQSGATLTTSHHSPDENHLFSTDYNRSKWQKMADGTYPEQNVFLLCDGGVYICEKNFSFAITDLFR